MRINQALPSLRLLCTRRAPSAGSSPDLALIDECMTHVPMSPLPRSYPYLVTWPYPHRACCCIVPPAVSCLFCRTLALSEYADG